MLKDSIVPGNVYGCRKYFLVIRCVDDEFVFYNFYNRDEYFFPPNNRKRVVDCATSAIICKEKKECFLKRVSLGKISEFDNYHGMDIRVGLNIRKSLLKENP